MLEQQLSSSVSRIVQPSRQRSGASAHSLVLPGDRGNMCALATRDMSKYTEPSAVVLSADTEPPATAWRWGGTGVLHGGLCGLRRVDASDRVFPGR